MTRSVLLILAALGACAAFGVAPALADVGPIQTSAKHFFWAPGQVNP